jgi:hypothetical protein
MKDVFMKKRCVDALLINLDKHSNGPNRNKIGITFNDHFSNISELKQRGLYVYRVYEYKGNQASNFFTLGIRAGMVTGYKYMMIDEDNKGYTQTYNDQSGTTY